ncbi:IclR family pca regulon transcriptional regulator [Erythromicrobium ramosum]|uniref:Helix-turn-helix domain-containing protein n=1 Tax=Erythrobacter ramosus TaxID=35811 RepID=A0A6I4UL69_9SPHN|nr:IclR family transcriptional regulator C-terminal domain-containing protein [Erythrobacter ramosus]MBB3774187.1 IclR family pca regulon transcriptional regulator [Erythrobacter ramosus]MXP38155.1 helix-turn-helix domain-containing protein [Erythrobacter ramosus]
MGSAGAEPADKVAGGKDPEFLSTLERGLRVLKAFDEDHPEMTLSEVAAKTALPPAVARRCLITLVELGYVGQHERKFLLRPAVLTIGSAFLASMQIEQVVLPPLQGLRDQTGDSASLAVLSGAEILYVAHVSTDRRFRVAAGVGTRFPFHATSLGKALAAYLPEGERTALMAGAPFQRFTERTVTDGAALAERLNLITQRGYDSALDELDYGIVSVAVPIFGRDKRVIAAINCSTSTTRISQDELVRTRLPLLRAAAGEIEASLKRWPALEASLRP